MHWFGEASIRHLRFRPLSDASLRHQARGDLFYHCPLICTKELVMRRVFEVVSFGI